MSRFPFSKLYTAASNRTSFAGLSTLKPSKSGMLTSSFARRHKRSRPSEARRWIPWVSVSLEYQCDRARSTNVIVGAFSNVLELNNSSVDMLLDLVCQLPYIPLSLEWVAATPEKRDQFVVAILIAVRLEWPVVTVIHGEIQVRCRAIEGRKGRRLCTCRRCGLGGVHKQTLVFARGTHAALLGSCR
jgi:hypothetical protein